MTDDLDAGLRRADPDRWLSSRFIADSAARADVVAVYAYDHELARAVSVASNLLTAEMRLTWWREALDEIFASGAVRRHPVAEALATSVRRRALARDRLQSMIDVRLDALGTPFDVVRASAWARAVGGGGAALAVRILDPEANVEAAIPAGAVWALMTLRRSNVLSDQGVDARIAADLPAAARAARPLGAAAFPAVAHAALVRTRSASGLEARLRLLPAVALGRL